MTSTAAEREFTRIGVVGLGTMGAGIAEVFARNGFEVTGVEVNDEALERGRQHLEHSTGRAVARGKLTEADVERAIAAIADETGQEATVAEVVPWGVRLAVGGDPAPPPDRAPQEAELRRQCLRRLRAEGLLAHDAN